MMMICVVLYGCADEDLQPSRQSKNDIESTDTLRTTFAVHQPVIEIDKVLRDIIAPPKDTVKTEDPGGPSGDPNGGGKPSSK